jgi:ABC-type transport system substrate-binding protein
LAVLALVVLAQGDEKPAPKDKPKTEAEQFDPKPRKPKETLRVDEGPAVVKKSAALRPTDLATEAEQTAYLEIRRLFRALAAPHDVITTASETLNVEPLEIYPQVPSNEALPVTVLNAAGKRDKQRILQPNQAKTYMPYEELAVREAQRFLDEPAGKKPLTRLEKLRAVEKALAAVLRDRESAWERNLRKGSAWEDCKQKLRDELVRAQLEQLQELSAAKADEADELANQLHEAYPQRADVTAKIVNLRAVRAEQALAKADFLGARTHLEQIEKLSPNSDAAERVRRQLSQQARKLLAEAREAAKSDRSRAIGLLQQATEIWPRLEGLQDEQLKLNNSYPILYVGVRNLPRQLSPATAGIDSERQALALIFESLVAWRHDPQGGQTYQGQLARGRPVPVQLGRQFSLAADAFWADGRQVTAADVRHTVQLLLKTPSVGASAGFDKLLRGATVGGDPFTVSVTLGQGYVDPLSLMSFPIVPTSLGRPDDPLFAEHPVGSGPFQFKGRQKDEAWGREAAVFVANHNFRRAGQPPFIREVRMIETATPDADLLAGRRLHMVCDLATSEIKPFVNHEVYTLPSRRVWFLAVNHRRQILQDRDLRRALAASIDRKKILDVSFRAGNAELHKPLNGPFPAGSWACDANLPADPHERALAESLLSKNTATGELTLKFPDNDARAAQACAAIEQSWNALNSRVKIKRVPTPPRQLHDDVEVTHSYDLAYYHWDHSSEAYWLWPLFDPRPDGHGGPRNFLGCQNDAELLGLLERSMAVRQFSTLQSIYHQLHQHLYDTMPLIPLWQLETHVAVARQVWSKGKMLTKEDLDPLALFVGAESWQLQGR